jgi:hypothetical protein
MRRITIMIMVAAALLVTTAAPAALTYADGACWTCNSAS